MEGEQPSGTLCMMVLHGNSCLHSHLFTPPVSERNKLRHILTFQRYLLSSNCMPDVIQGRLEAQYYWTGRPLTLMELSDQ